MSVDSDSGDSMEVNVPWKRVDEAEVQENKWTFPDPETENSIVLMQEEHELAWDLLIAKGDKSVKKPMDAAQWFLSEDLSDIQMVCIDENKSETTFPAHRFVLAYYSSVFDRMVQSDMKEAKEGRIVIEDMSPRSVKEFLRFMYTGKFLVTDDVTFDLYKAADKYDMGSLKLYCQWYLVQRLSIQNAVDVFLLGDTYECSILKDKSFQIIKEYKDEMPREKIREFHKRNLEQMLLLHHLWAEED